VVVTITGTNDAPVIAADTGVHGLTEGDAALTTSGSLAVSDADVINTVAASVVGLSVGGDGNASRPAGLTDPVLQAMLSVDTGSVIDNISTTGTIHWAFNSNPQAFDFLATGETLQFTYTIRATDSDASHATDDQTVVVTITGTNDAPEITADTSGTAGSNVHDLTEGDAALTTSGSLAVSDADVTNTVAASVAGLSVGGSGIASRPAGLTDAVLQAMLSVDTGNVIDNAHTSDTIHWNFDSDPQAFDFLATGETLQLTYTIRATDSDASHATDDQTVVINITGTNDAPVISTADLQVSEGSSTTISGLSISDADASPAAFFTVTAEAASGSSVTFAAGTSPGTLADINAALHAGFTYHPGTTPPPTDMITLTVADAATATDTVNFIFSVADPPASTPIVLTSTSEKDVLFGTSHADRFVFGVGSNHDTIVDFTAGIDHIDLSALSAIVDAANINSFLADNVTSLGGGSDTLITLDSNDTITLRGVALCSLHAGDFIVHAG
jgi:VCBS repeat-containing protein